MKKILKLLLTFIVLINCFACTQRNENDDETRKLYLEQPTITTCSNNENLNLQIRFLCNDKNYTVSNYEIQSSMKYILIDTLAVHYFENEDGSLVVIFHLNLIMPVGKTNFDLHFNIDNETYTLKNITHTNFNNDFNFDSLEFVFNSIYTEEEGQPQEYTNNIVFNNFDVTNAEFNILGEEVKSIDKIGKNQVCIISTNNKSAVVGYYCIIDGNMYSIGNAYHTEYLDKTKFSKM